MTSSSFGKNQEAHDKALLQTSQWLQSAGLTLNRSKCLFNQTKMAFFRIVLSAKRVSPDPKKVEAVKQAESLKSVAEVRSLLGLANYVKRFIVNYADIVEPLLKLTRTDVKWQWTKKCQCALDTLEHQLSEDTVMAHYDPNLEVNITTDASPVGLGAILEQYSKADPENTRHIVAYASKTLTDTERRYS